VSTERLRHRQLSLHVEYAERGTEYGISFIFSLFREYMHLEYVRIPVIYRVDQVEYVIQRRFIYKGDTSTHAQGTDPRVALGA